MFDKIHHRIIIPVILTVALFMGSCEKDLDTPPLRTIDAEPNFTISELLELYDGSVDFFTIPPITFTDPDTGEEYTEEAVLEVVVIANDKSGNFYRQLIIQDASAGIELKVHQTNLHEQYPVGQKLYIMTEGLILNSFGGIVQLGGNIFESTTGPRLGGIEPANISQHLIRLPGGEIPSPTEVNLGENLDAYIYTMVTLHDVQFSTSELGNTFANPNQTTNRLMVDCHGNSIIVRTSSFADFAGNELPAGNGTITAVLSKFANEYQLLIHSYEDLDMTGERCDVEGEPTGSGSFEDPYNVAAAVAASDEEGVWVEGYIVGVRETHVEPWVNNFEGPFTSNSNIILADSPEVTGSTQLLFVQLPIGDVRDAINLAGNPAMHQQQVRLRGNLGLYFGFRGLRDTWDYWMEGMPDPEPDPDPQETIFEENFTTNLGQFTDYNITGQQTWQWVHYNNGSASMNGFVGGSARANENWLISPAIDLEEKTGVILRLWEAINFITNYNDMQVLIAADFDESDPTSSGTWEHITGFNRPAGNNWNVVESGDIDLSQFEGQTIHIAFKYISTTSGAAAWQLSRIELVADE